MPSWAHRLPSAHEAASPEAVSPKEEAPALRPGLDWTQLGRSRGGQGAVPWKPAAAEAARGQVQEALAFPGSSRINY